MSELIASVSLDSPTTYPEFGAQVASTGTATLTSNAAGGVDFTVTSGDARFTPTDVNATTPYTFTNTGSGAMDVTGAAGADIALGGTARDVIYLNGGNNTASGGGGDDEIGAFKDGVSAASKRVRSQADGQAQAGNNFFDGGEGNDTVRGAAGNDTIMGGVGDDLLQSGDGNNIVLGDIGNDTLMGGKDLDRLQGGAGKDFLMGGAGNDQLQGGADKDRLMGGEGVDRFRFEKGAINVKNFKGRRDLKNVDKVVDFDPNAEVIELSKQIFKGKIKPGKGNNEFGTKPLLNEGDFASVKRATKGIGAKLVYEQSTGLVYCNTSKGLTPLVQLGKNLDISASNFELF